MFDPESLGHFEGRRIGGASKIGSIETQASILPSSWQWHDGHVEELSKDSAAILTANIVSLQGRHLI